MQAYGVLDPCGNRQMDMQACPLGSLLAGINEPVRESRISVGFLNPI